MGRCLWVLGSTTARGSRRLGAVSGEAPSPGRSFGRYYFALFDPDVTSGVPALVRLADMMVRRESPDVRVPGAASAGTGNLVATSFSCGSRTPGGQEGAKG